MPTGYTSMIEDGKVNSGKEFLKVCIRNFGCCIGQRDDPLSAPLITEIKPSSYYKDRYKEAIKELENFDKQSTIDRKEILLKAKNDELNRLEKCIEEGKQINKKYRKIRQEVEKWNPPTPDHEGIKKFALEQIDISIIDLSFYYDRKRELLNDSLEEYAEPEKRERENLLRDIKYYKEEMEKEEARVSSRNLYLKQFIDSLEEV